MRRQRRIREALTAFADWDPMQYWDGYEVCMVCGFQEVHNHADDCLWVKANEALGRQVWFDLHVPEKEPATSEVDWTCVTCGRAIAIADSYVVNTSGDKPTAYHGECEP